MYPSRSTPVNTVLWSNSTPASNTLVETTISFLFHLKCLIARPMTFSDSPFAYPSAQSKKLILQRNGYKVSVHHTRASYALTYPASNAALRQAKVLSSPT